MSMKKSAQKQISDDFVFDDLENMESLNPPSMGPPEDISNPKSKLKLSKKKSSKSKSKEL